MLRFIYRLFFTIVGKILQELSLIAALLSLAHGGSYVDRLLGAIVTILGTCQQFGVAFYHNTPFPTVIGELKAGIDATMDGMTQSLTQDPQSALVALVISYVILKIAAFLCRLARAACPRRRKPTGPSTAGKPSISKQLYEDETC